MGPDADGVGSTQPLADDLKQGIAKHIPFHQELLQMGAEEEVKSPQSQVNQSFLLECISNVSFTKARACLPIPEQYLLAATPELFTYKSFAQAFQSLKNGFLYLSCSSCLET